MYLNIFMMFEKFEIKKVYWFLANWPKKTKWYIIMTVVEETACFFFYISHDFPLHIVGVFFQSRAWYSVFSVAEHAI